MSGGLFLGFPKMSVTTEDVIPLLFKIEEVEKWSSSFSSQLQKT